MSSPDDKMVRDGLAAARFFEEHQQRIAREESERDLLQAAILLGALLLGLVIRAFRGKPSPPKG